MSLSGLPLLATLAVLGYVAYTDLRWRIIPNRVILPASGVALLWSIASGRVQTSLLGAALAAALFLVPIVIYGPNLAGMGDVKLGLFLGLSLGFPAVVTVLLVSFAIAFAVGLAGVLTGRAQRQSTLPMAPFIALGVIPAALLHLAT